MRQLFILISLLFFPTLLHAQEESVVTDAIRYIFMTDGQVIAIPEKYIQDEVTEDGVCVLSLKGGVTYTYAVSDVLDITDSYEFAELSLNSFRFTHEDNDQVYADVDAVISDDGDIIRVTADVPVIGKRLRPSFTLSDGATMWVDGVQQVSGQSSQRFTEPLLYTLAAPNHWIYDVTSGFKPFGRTCMVTVKYLTDYATGDYKIPTV